MRGYTEKGLEKSRKLTRVGGLTYLQWLHGKKLTRLPG